MIQGSEEWRLARCGRITSSKIHVLVANGRGGAPSVQRENYRAQLVAERLTGIPSDEDFESAAMARGKEQEPFARAAYEARAGVLVDQVGFVEHPTLRGCGASPDGLAGEDGIVEIKCPNTKTHIAYLLDGVAPKDYAKQIQWILACTGRKWCDFVSFDRRLPEHLQLFVVRVERDEAEIQRLENAARDFHQEVEGLIAKLQEGRQ